MILARARLLQRLRGEPLSRDRFAFTSLLNFAHFLNNVCDIKDCTYINMSSIIYVHFHNLYLSYVEFYYHCGTEITVNCKKIVDCPNF